MKEKKRWIVLVIFGFVFWGVTTVVESSAQVKREYFDRLLYIRRQRILKVGVNVGFVPFEFKNEKGKIVGFDVDIAKKLAEALHSELVIKEYSWDDLIPALKSLGQIDVIISGMTRTLDRALEVNFTAPYFVTGQVVVVSTKNIDINDYTELDKKEFKIGTVKKTTSEKVCKKKFSNASLVRFKSEADPDIVGSLINGEIDAFVFDKPFIDFLHILHPQLKVLPKQLSYEYYSFAVEKGDPDFLRWLDYFISELELSGEYEKIYNYWFIEQTWKPK